MNDPGFANAFGGSFQKYVGDAIQRACPSGKMRLIPEASYGSKQRRKDTVDWIATNDRSALFIECKAKRPSWGAKIAFDDLRPLERDLEAMADAVVQIYKTISDYESGAYPNFEFASTRRIYPVVVTLERWHLFGSVLLDILCRSILAKLGNSGISSEAIEKMPFSIWHISELERGMQIAEEAGIQTLMDQKLQDTEMREWEWHSYMTQAFKRQYRNRALFDDEYLAMFGKMGL